MGARAVGFSALIFFVFVADHIEPGVSIAAQVHPGDEAADVVGAEKVPRKPIEVGGV
jgi:hypothetical protein